MTALKEGQRVRFIAEGTVGAMYASGEHGDCLDLDTEHGSVYIEVGKILKPFLEIIPEPLPTEDGWYEAEKYPLGTPGVSPYELLSGEWYLAGARQSETFMRTVGTLYRLGRVS